jgi:hypothetical protein
LFLSSAIQWYNQEAAPAHSPGCVCGTCEQLMGDGCTYRFVLTVLTVVLFSCSTIPVRQDTTAVVIGKVPFYPQEVHQCGPASLAGVLNYWNVAVTPEDIAKEIYSRSAKGTLTIDMLLYARGKGLEAQYYAGGWDDVVRKVNSGHPLIVLVDNGFYVYQLRHFMVVVGYADDHVVANSGGSERMRIDKEKFLEAWKKTGYWTLWIKKDQK